MYTYNVELNEISQKTVNRIYWNIVYTYCVYYYMETKLVSNFTYNFKIKKSKYILIK